MATPNANGNPNSFFIDWVRRELRDQPVRYGPEAPATDGVTGTTAANSKPFRTKRQPVISGSMSLTGPTVTYTPVYDTAGDAPTVAPVIIDAGVGAFAAGTYRVAYTYVYGAAGESGLSPFSNALTIAINRSIAIDTILGLPAGVTGVNVYFVLPAAVQGLSGALVIAGTQANGSVLGPGNAVLPVMVNSDTGEILFAVAPAAGALSYSYSATRFSDQQILDALQNGMFAIFPEVWQTQQDVSIVTSSVYLEYALPALFLNENVKIMRLEVQPPGYGSFKLWYERRDWEVMSGTLLKLYRVFPSGSILRLTYNAPYNVLSDVEPDKMKLPVYYALGELYLVQETSRARQDDLAAQTGGQVSQTGAAGDVANLWFSRFEMEMRRLGRESPTRHSVNFGSTASYGSRY